MTIYYSHSTSDYNTPKEAKELQIIREQNPGVKIINPRDFKIQPCDKKYFHYLLKTYFYPAIDKCDIIYYSRNETNKITQMVQAEIQYGYYKKKSVYQIIEQIPSNDRLLFYKRNPDLITGMLNFFKLEKGLRCVVLRPFDEDIPYVYHNSLSRYNYALQPLTTRNFANSVWYSRTIQFLSFIMSHTVFENNRKADIYDHVIGITPIIEIDSDDIDIDKKSKGRVDVLSDQKYIDDFDNIIGVFRDKLTELDEKIEQIIFTGNGFQILLEDYYDDDIQEIFELRDAVVNVEKYVREKTDCNVHAKRYGWSGNFKPPYTFHFNNNRLTLPLQPDKKIDLDYLVRYSNPRSEVYK